MMEDKKEVYWLHLGASSCSDYDSDGDIEFDEVHKSNKPPAYDYEAIQDKIVKIPAKTVPVLNIWDQSTEVGTSMTTLDSDSKMLGAKKNKKKASKIKKVKIVEPDKNKPLKFDIHDENSFPAKTVPVRNIWDQSTEVGTSMSTLDLDLKISGKKKNKKKASKIKKVNIVEPDKKKPLKIDIQDENSFPAKTVPVLNIWDQSTGTSMTTLDLDSKMLGTKKKKKKALNIKKVKIVEPDKKKPLKFDIHDENSFPPLGKNKTVHKNRALTDINDTNMFPPLAMEHDVLHDLKNVTSIDSSIFPPLIPVQNILQNGNKMILDQQLRISPNFVTEASIHEDGTVNSYYFMHMSQLSVLRCESVLKPSQIQLDALNTYLENRNIGQNLDKAESIPPTTNEGTIIEHKKKNKFNMVTENPVASQNYINIKDSNIDKVDILVGNYNEFLELPDNWDINEQNLKIVKGCEISYDSVKEAHQKDPAPIQRPIKKKKKNRKKSKKIIIQNFVNNGSEKVTKDSKIFSNQSKLLNSLKFSCIDYTNKENKPKNTKPGLNNCLITADSIGFDRDKKHVELISNLSKDRSLVTHYYSYEGEQFPTFCKYRELYLFGSVQTLIRLTEQTVVNTVKNHIGSIELAEVTTYTTKNENTEPHYSNHTLKIISNSYSNLNIIYEKREGISDKPWIEIWVPPTLNTIDIDSNYIKSPMKNRYYSTEDLDKLLKLSNVDIWQCKVPGITKETINLMPYVTDGSFFQTTRDADGKTTNQNYRNLENSIKPNEKVLKKSKKKTSTSIKNRSSPDETTVNFSKDLNLVPRHYFDPLNSKNSLTVQEKGTVLDGDRRDDITMYLLADPSLVSHYYLYQSENFEFFCKFRDVYLFENLENVYKTIKETVDKAVDENKSRISLLEVEEYKCDSKDSKCDCRTCTLIRKFVHIMILFLAFLLIVNIINCIATFLVNNFVYFCLLFVLIELIEI